MAQDTLSLSIIQPMSDPLMTVYQKAVDSVPKLLAAAVVLVVGYIVAWFLGLCLKKVLERAHCDRYCVDKTILRKLLGDFHLSATLGMLLKWWVFSYFLASAATFLALGPLQDLLVSLGNVWIPRAIGAFLLALFGLVLADYVAHLIKGTRARYSGVLSDVARWTIIVLVLMMVLETLGVQTEFPAEIVKILVTGAVFAISLALGLAFGLGGKEEAKKCVTKYSKKRR